MLFWSFVSYEFVCQLPCWGGPECTLERAVLGELMWVVDVNRGWGRTLSMGRATGKAHALMGEWVFPVPEGRETLEVHPSTAKAHPTLSTICQDSTAPSFAPRQPEPFSPKAADLLAYENTSCLSWGLEMSVLRHMCSGMTPEALPH